MNGNRETVTIISANLTCWSKHAEKVLATKADALVLQETRLNRLTQVRASRKAAFQGYDAVWGQGMKQMKTRLRGKNLVGNESLRKSTMYGGVGILANQKTLPGMLAAGTKDGAAATLAESGRYVRAAIPLKREGRKQFLHITNMYLEPQFDTPAQARKERMMKLALEDIAKLGDQAALICVDQNCSSMAIMEAAIEAGDWVDLGKRFAIGDPEPTYGRDKAWDRIAAEHRTSRPDRVYANAIAAQAITRYRLIRHTGIPQHLPIEIKFRAATLKKKYIAIQPSSGLPS